MFTIRHFPQVIGFDSLFDELQRLADSKVPQYPPFNIRKIGENRYMIEMAVAGFKTDEIEVRTENQHLVVRGNKPSEDDETDVKWIHRGIAARSFEHSLRMSDDMVVKGAGMADGILTVGIERVIPEEKQPRVIPIGSGTDKLLT